MKNFWIIGHTLLPMTKGFEDFFTLFTWFYYDYYNYFKIKLEESQ